MGLQTSCNLPSIPARVAEQLHILDALRRITMHYVFRRSKEKKVKKSTPDVQSEQLHIPFFDVAIVEDWFDFLNWP